MSRSITTRGRPTELNIIFKLKIPAIDTDGVLSVVKKIMNDIVRSVDIAKSIPCAWAANMTPVANMIMVPGWLRDDPSGMVNEEMSRETPISSRVSICRGIVAFDDDEENAKTMTGKYFLKNFIGFDLVKTKIKIG